jgi:hypothetical protein
MVFWDYLGNASLLKLYVQTETVASYIKGIKQIKAKGYHINAVVCDGRRGLMQSIADPVQMCHFHQIAIITRYLTNYPRADAAIELRKIRHQLPKSNEKEFTQLLVNWKDKWDKYLNERSINPITGKSSYTHKRLRSAYRSLHTNLKYLFTYLEYPHFKIPNTTNPLEVRFANMKNKLLNHIGLKWERKKQIINEFF